MQFARHLRERIRNGQIRTTVRVWMRPHVKVGGRYAFGDALAVKSGFRDVEDLLKTAKHGRGETVYLIRFHYVPEGAWDAFRSAR